MKTHFFIEPLKVTKLLLFALLVLFFGHCLFLFSSFIYGYSYRNLFSIFDFNGENNLPTLFSVVILSFTAFLLISIGFIKKKVTDTDFKYWFILGAIFILLSFDEASQFHESINKIVRSNLNIEHSDLFYFSWVIPYGIIIFILGLYFIKFIKSLPKRTAILFIFAGVIFVTGALGLELIGSYIFVNYGESHLFFNIESTFEELFEMLGIILFIYALLDFVCIYFGHDLQMIFFNNKEMKEREIKFSSKFDPKVKGNINKETITNKH